MGDDAGVDYVIGETFIYAREALLAVDVIRKAGVPAVVTLAVLRTGLTGEGWTPSEACQRLTDAGADVVGLNCIRGPETMLPLLSSVRSAVDGHIAALPVAYRTDKAHPRFSHSGTATGRRPIRSPARRSPLPAHGTTWRNSPRRQWRWELTTWVSAAAERHTMSGAWWKLWVELHRRAGIRLIRRRRERRATPKQTGRLARDSPGSKSSGAGGCPRPGDWRGACLALVEVPEWRLGAA